MNDGGMDGWLGRRRRSRKVEGGEIDSEGRGGGGSNV